MADLAPSTREPYIPDTSQPEMIAGEDYGTSSETPLKSADSLGKPPPFSDTYRSRLPSDTSSEQNGGSPWHTLANVVMAYEETRVENALKDVESLLRYAGLFSVVLTGFFLESVRSLSLDTSQEILNTLRNVYTLEYLIYRELDTGLTRSLPFFDVAFPDGAPRSFQPSTTDINVNILWCTSLLLSLTAASLSLATKQWFREYLAVDNPSPQARLRIHYVRYQELVRWRVFQIVAALPFLQQSAFALFFVGLCYRTASIHESLGNVCYALVIGWAFCIGTITLLPSFFPRCPYKTTLIVAPLYSLHMWVASLVRDILSRLAYPNQEAYEGYFRDKMTGWALINSIYLCEHIDTSDESKIASAERADTDILVDIDARQSNDELLRTTIFSCLQAMRIDRSESVRFILRVLQHRITLDIPTITRSWKPVPLDLRILSYSGYAAIIDILSYFMAPLILQSVHSSGATTIWRDCQDTMTTFYILLSASRWPIPQSGLTILDQVLRHQGTEFIRMLARSVPHAASPMDDKFSLLVHGLDNALHALDVDAASSLQLLEALIGTRFEDARLNSELDVKYPEGTFSLLEGFDTWPWRSAMSSDTRLEAARLAIQTVHRALRHIGEDPYTKAIQKQPNLLTESHTPQSFNSLVDAIVAMWNMANVGRIEVYSHTQELNFGQAIGDCLLTREGTLALLKAICRIKTKVIVHAQTNWVAPPFEPSLLVQGLCTIRYSMTCSDSSNAFALVLVTLYRIQADTEKKLKNLIGAVEELSKPTVVEDGSNLTMLHVLLIFYVALHMVALPDSLSYATQWRDLLHALAHLGDQLQGAASSGSTTSDDTQEVAQLCTQLVQACGARGSREDLSSKEPNNGVPRHEGQANTLEDMRIPFVSELAGTLQKILGRAQWFGSDGGA